MKTTTDYSQNFPPRLPATDNLYQVNSSAAGVADLWANYTADVAGLKTPQGPVWLEFAASGGTVTFRLQRTNAATSVTATTGVSLFDSLNGGPSIRLRVDPRIDLFVDITGTGSLKWRRVGPELERSRI